jgi:hypothetical protein
MGSLDHKQRHQLSRATIRPKPTDRNRPTANPTKVERLQENWFATAADVAAMSREDRHSLKVPLRVWTHIAAALGISIGPEPSGSLLLSGSGALAVTSSSKLGPPGEEALGDDDDEEEEEDELDADIMLRRAPPRRRTFAREHVKVTKRVQQAPYGLRVSERGRRGRGLGGVVGAVLAG